MPCCRMIGGVTGVRSGTLIFDRRMIRHEVIHLTQSSGFHTSIDRRIGMYITCASAPAPAAAAVAAAVALALAAAAASSRRATIEPPPLVD